MSGGALILEGFGPEDQVQMSIWDLTGRLIRSSTISQQGSQVEVRSADLPFGFYIVDLVSIDRRWTRRVLVKEKEF